MGEDVSTAVDEQFAKSWHGALGIQESLIKSGHLKLKPGSVACINMSPKQYRVKQVDGDHVVVEDEEGKEESVDLSTGNLVLTGYLYFASPETNADGVFVGDNRLEEATKKILGTMEE